MHSNMWTYINWLRIDREVVNDLFHAEKVGNKHFKDFLEKLVEENIAALASSNANRIMKITITCTSRKNIETEGFQKV